MKTLKYFLMPLMALMMLSCTPSAHTYPPGHGILKGNEFLYNEYTEDETSIVCVKLYTDLYIYSMERRVAFPGYAFLCMGESKEITENIGGNVYETVDYDRFLYNAQLFRFSIDEQNSTITLEYTDPAVLPDILNDSAEYESLMESYYPEDFDLAGQPFVGEGGKLVLDRIADDTIGEDGDYYDYDYSLEIDGVTYLLKASNSNRGIPNINEDNTTY